jgi:hypothetical protein
MAGRKFGPIARLGGYDRPDPNGDDSLIQSGTDHDQVVVGNVSAFPARSVIVRDRATDKVAGSDRELGSSISMAAVFPSGPSVTVVATTLLPIVSVTDRDVSDDVAIASEKVIAMGARRTTPVAPATGVVDVTLGAVRSTFTVIGGDATGWVPAIALATIVCGPSGTAVVSQEKL